MIPPLTLAAVRRVDALFAIEQALNGQSSVHQELARPLVADLEAWMREQRAKAVAWEYVTVHALLSCG
jgi:transposase